MTSPSLDTSTLPAAELLALYRTMIRIRLTEERLATAVEQGEIKTPCHLYIGQEAIAAGVCAALDRDDYVWGAHRSHGHYLAKGGDLTTMLAEILGRVTGCSRGRGGSMHLYAGEVGIYGTTPIVAGTTPLAVGAALAASLRGERRVSVTFFGDGAMEEGHVHESMNFAALQRLPVLFVCENNFYSSHLALRERRVADNLVEFGRVHGMASERVDGNDVEAVAAAAQAAVAHMRDGGGPHFLECRTYRWRGHVGPSWDEDVGVQRSNELMDWLPRDPIAATRRRLLAAGVDAAVLDAVTPALEHELDVAFATARQAPAPAIESLTAHVYMEKG